MNIAVLDLAVSGWTAGSVVSRTVALALASVDQTVYFVSESSGSDAPSGCKVLPVRKSNVVPGENSFRALFGLPRANTAAHAVSRARPHPDVVLPVIDGPLLRTPAVGWIPDFQSKTLPCLFSERERGKLDKRWKKLAQGCRVMWCSSNAVAEDFRIFVPQHADKVRVAQFPSVFAYEPPPAFDDSVQLRWPVPAKFLLVINQFWKHKNHKIVAEALGILRSGGLSIPAVMAGMPADYRDKQNSALSETLQTLAEKGCWSDCMVLGKVGRQDILQLLRRATVLVQPSKFEGWNTTVEDAKALGCPVILSDLAVHREQCPDALGFFSCDDARSLAEIIARSWNKLDARPDPQAEKLSLAAARKRAISFGTEMARICEQAIF